VLPTGEVLKLVNAHLNEVSQTLSGSQVRKISIPSREKVTLKKVQAPKELQHESPLAKAPANLNIQFNNSFNSVFNSTDQLPDQKPEGLPVQKQDSLTSSQMLAHRGDALILEKQLTSRLHQASELQKMHAFEHTFAEVIKRDTHFGSLLLKIKEAYDEYLRKFHASREHSPKAEEADTHKLKQQLMVKDQEIERLNKQEARTQKQMFQLKEQTKIVIEENDELLTKVMELSSNLTVTKKELTSFLNSPKNSTDSAGIVKMQKDVQILMA